MTTISRLHEGKSLEGKIGEHWARNGEKLPIVRHCRLDLTRSVRGDVASLSGKDVFVVAPFSSEHTIRRLEKLNLTESQRLDAINYNLGQVIEFHRRRAADSRAASNGKWREAARKASSSSRMGKQNSCHWPMRRVSTSTPRQKSA